MLGTRKCFLTVLIIAFCFLGSRAYSFQVEIEKTEKTVDSLIVRAKSLFYTDSTQSRLVAEKALMSAYDIDYGEGIAKSWRRLGSYHLVRGELNKSLSYYQLNYDYYFDIKDTLGLGRASLSISQVTGRLGDKVRTLDFLQKGTSFAQGASDWKTYARILSSLGNYYRNEGEYDEAQNYYELALKSRLEREDKLGIISSYQVLGNLFGIQGRHQKAKSYYIKSLSLVSEQNLSSRKAGLLTNLGVTYYKLSFLDSAEYFYQKALKLRKESGNIYSQTLLLNNLTALAFERKNYRQSIDYAEEGLVLAKEVGSPELLSSLYYNLSDGYKALGDYKRSFEYYKLSDSIDYEITNTEKNAQLAELQVKFDTEKKDKEIAQQNLDLTRADTQKKQLFAGIGLLILVAGFISWSLVRKRRSNTRLQAQKSLIEKREQEKALLLRELHHRVKNNFQVVSSLLNLQYYEAESTGAAEAIKAGQTRVEAMSMIHRELYQGENDTALEMKDYVVHLIENAIYMYDFEPDAVDLQLEIDDSPLDVKYAIPLGIIINELITNAFKHAFQSVTKPALSVYLNMDAEAQKLTLKVGDNGPGIRENNEARASSFGLELIGDLMKQLKGKLTSNNEKGAEFTIVFPYVPLSQHVES